MPHKLKSMGISGDLFNLLKNYLSGRLQRVVLNGKPSSWRPVLAGVPQGSILGPLLFSSLYQCLTKWIKSNSKLFAKLFTSLFTIVKDKQESVDVLNNDLSLIYKWAFNWKILINPGTNKPLFSRKKKTQNHPNISLDNIQVERVSHQKHLGLILDEKLNFKEHIDSIILKVNRGIAVLKKLIYSLPRKSPITIYKNPLRVLLDYGDIFYVQPHNEFAYEKFESVQYKVALAITGATQGTSREKIY